VSITRSCKLKLAGEFVVLLSHNTLTVKDVCKIR